MAKKRVYNVRTKSTSYSAEMNESIIRDAWDALLVEHLIPIATDALARIAQMAADEGVRLTKAKFIPFLKMKYRQSVPVVKAKMKRLKLRFKNRKKANTNADDNNGPKLYSQKEVDQIMENMQYAICYIASGIRELSEAVASGIDDPEKKAEVEKKLQELSSDNMKSIIDFTLERKNRYLLDRETLKMFKAFKHDELIVNGELVPIKNYVKIDNLII